MLLKVNAVAVRSLPKRVTRNLAMSCAAICTFALWEGDQPGSHLILLAIIQFDSAIMWPRRFMSLTLVLCVKKHKSI